MKKVNINFIPVSGKDLISKMYLNGNPEKEDVIEDVYKLYTYKASMMNVETLKKGFYGTRETTDGYMAFSIDGDEKFYGIQEVKRKVCNSYRQYCKQLLQALRYLWLYRNDSSIKVIILNSEKYYVYVLVDEILDLINELSPLFSASNKSASETWKDITLKNKILHNRIPFHIKNLNEDFSLDEVLRTIYQSCL